MSKQMIKDLTASEMVCFVCMKDIESLKELRSVYRGESDLYDKGLERLAKDVNYEVIWIKGKDDKFWTMRHIDCDPFNRKKFTVDDL